MVGVWEQGHRKQREGGLGNRGIGSREKGETWEQGCREQREEWPGNRGIWGQRRRDIETGWGVASKERREIVSRKLGGLGKGA